MIATELKRDLAKDYKQILAFAVNNNPQGVTDYLRTHGVPMNAAPREQDILDKLISLNWNAQQYLQLLSNVEYINTAKNYTGGAMAALNLPQSNNKISSETLTIITSAVLGGLAALQQVLQTKNNTGGTGGATPPPPTPPTNLLDKFKALDIFTQIAICLVVAGLVFLAYKKFR